MAILCRSLGRVGGVDEEILIRCGADMVGSGRHGDFLCVVCLSGVSCHFCELLNTPCWLQFKTTREAINYMV